MDGSISDEIELGEFNIDSFLRESEANINVPYGKESFCQRQIVIAVDASNSMQGYKIGAVNDTVNNILAKLKTFSRGQGDAISISVIGFSARLFRWTDQFVPIGNFKYSYVETADGLTDVNVLFDELVRLTENGMDKNAKKFVVLFSDGLPTEDYSSSFSKWHGRGQYKDVTKIAVSFDEDINDPQSMDFFQKFTDHGQVIRIKDQEALLSVLLN